jgi:hypothetical protein
VVLGQAKKMAVVSNHKNFIYSYGIVLGHIINLLDLGKR